MAKTTINTAGIGRYLERLAANAQNAADAAAAIARTGTEATVPVDEGDLKASLTNRPLPPRGRVYQAELTAGEGLSDSRAIFTEFGTVTQAAQFWWQRGIANAADGVNDAIIAELKKR